MKFSFCVSEQICRVRSEVSAQSNYQDLILHKRIIRITVQPSLSRFGRSNHRMSTRVRVLSRVAVWGVITTKRCTTCLTSPQMDPACADFDALFAFSARRVLDLDNGV
jgi:hypothetical protein